MNPKRGTGNRRREEGIRLQTYLVVNMFHIGPLAESHTLLIRYRIPYSTRTQRYGGESTCKVEWMKWAGFNTIVHQMEGFIYTMLMGTADAPSAVT